MIELTILNDHNYYETYSPIPKDLITLDNGRELNLKKYLLLPAQRLDRIEGLIEMATMKITGYSLKDREYSVASNIRVVVQKNKVIPILRTSIRKEKKISNLWPIIE